MNENTSKTQEPAYTPLFTGILETDKARLYSLVLTATAIPHRVQQINDGNIILVRENYYPEAVRQIRLFEQENPARKDQDTEHQSMPLKYAYKTIWTLFSLTAFMALGFRYEIRQTLLEIGAADANRIVDGEYWRSVTALFLHADPAHLFSNLVIGGFIIFWLIEETGPGTGWLLVLITGAAGNYLNALAHGHDGHLSIGASTAVFGALGALFSIRAVRHGKKGLFKEAAKVLGAGLALLSMLGTGKENIDIGAHLFGFASGLLAGLGGQLFSEHIHINIRYKDRILGAIALVITLAAWLKAALSWHHY